MEGVKRYEVELKEHNPAWEQEFSETKLELQNALHDVIIDIQHVGSTAIPSISAKPILDIAILLRCINDEAVKKLETLGYDYRGAREDNVNYHLFVLRAPGEISLHHIHCYDKADKGFEKLVAFRDYMNKNPQCALEYNKLKKRLAEKYRDNRPLYTSGKAEFIQAVYDKIENEQYEEAFPNYYHKFKCIADKCKHSCCIGWEIDVDDDTMQMYNSLGGEMGDRIRRNIEGEPPHFIPGEGERCPFLNKTGLCDIILECGEAALCDICALHPRFKNFYSSFEEVGLGLCCEEAARIILSSEERFAIKLPEDAMLTEEEREFFTKRQEIFDILQDRERSISARFSALAHRFELEPDFSLESLRKVYLGLERLDDKWTDMLGSLKDISFDGAVFDENQTEFEQLAVYFVFRHLGGALYDGDFRSRVRFALMSCYLIGALFSAKTEKFNEIVRMYSSEIEYSEENTEALIGSYT